MLYDLNIAWSHTTPPAELERTLKFAKNLGYDVVALNNIVAYPFPTSPNAVLNPIPKLTPPHPQYPGGGGVIATTSTITTATNPQLIPTTSTKPGTTTTLSTTASSAAPTSHRSPLPTVLRRATVIVADPATTNYRLPDFARSYDLLAVRPTNDKAFAWCCLSTDAPCLVSLDLSSFLGWHIHHRTAMAAVHRGVRFEICYGQALAAGSDARMRANFIGNVLGLLRATKGRGIVVSSEARAPLGLRAPADVVNLMAVWGLGPERGAEAMGAGARLVVMNEGLKRRGFRGVVAIVKAAEKGEGEEGEKGEDKGQKQKQQGKKGAAGAAAQGGGKRKKGEAGGGGGDNPQGTVSKRQAKKLKQDAQA
ncbi:RNase P subunit p30-domain-containing protein [Bombardia bombarda]|uniref:RNase P subunit p30-domain-containing protein n=1 Tax=Bombardia bombarda TaxID=252184 RepID=A0AA39WMB2_9PEZI|nr:RNase P subunit p30-domain-containing protein [Bombardia bombarda]